MTLKEKKQRAEALKPLLQKLDGVLAELREGDELFIGHSSEGSIPGWQTHSYRVVRIERRSNSYLKLFFGKAALPVVEAVYLGGKSQSRSSVNHYAVMTSKGNGKAADLVSIRERQDGPALMLGGLNLYWVNPPKSPKRFESTEDCRKAMHDNFLACVRPDGVVTLLD